MANNNNNKKTLFGNLVSPFKNLIGSNIPPIKSINTPATPSPTGMTRVPFAPGMAPSPTTPTPIIPKISAPSITDQKPREDVQPAPKNFQEQLDAIQKQAIGIQGQLSDIQQPPTAPSITGGEEEKPPTAPPTISPETLKAISDAEKNVAKFSEISAGELSTQEDIDKLIDSARKGIFEAGQQAIPLEFITGQQKAIEQRALGLLEPLERKLARLEAKRLGSLASSEFALEREDKKAEAEREKARVDTDTFVDEGGNVILYNTQTGEPIKTIGKSKTDEDGFTLSPGQRRFDEEGNLIAEGGVAPKSEAQILKEQEKAEEKTKATSEAFDNLNLVNTLLNKDTDAVFGAKPPTYYIPGTQAQETKNLLAQIRAVLSIEKREKMKGSGAISDFEAQTLSESASALGPNLSNEAGRRELRRIRGVFLTATGNEADIIVTNRETGEKIETRASRDEINGLIAEGHIVEYN